ncbi:MAG: hypothetical protein M0T72_05845 [Candidatus Dormibacteraeota bacterium]|nr:hypothetical protein [Candidatus Dormibacteraeota bacterium]
MSAAPPGQSRERREGSQGTAHVADGRRDEGPELRGNTWPVGAVGTLARAPASKSGPLGWNPPGWWALMCAPMERRLTQRRPRPIPSGAAATRPLSLLRWDPARELDVPDHRWHRT